MLGQFRSFISEYENIEKLFAQNADIGTVRADTFDAFPKALAELRKYRESVRERHGLTFAEQKKQTEQFGQEEFDRRLSVLERHAAVRAAQEPEGDDLVSIIGRENRLLLEAVSL